MKGHYHFQSTKKGPVIKVTVIKDFQRKVDGKRVKIIIFLLIFLFFIIFALKINN